MSLTLMLYPNALPYLHRCSVCDSREENLLGEKAKCASLAQEIGFSAPNSCSLPRLVKVATQLCTSKKECNKSDMTGAQYF